jgi:hypothetical protein
MVSVRLGGPAPVLVIGVLLTATACSQLLGMDDRRLDPAYSQSDAAADAQVDAAPEEDAAPQDAPPQDDAPAATFGWAQWPMAETGWYNLGGGVVVDNVTGLVWQGQVPSGEFTWAEAKAYCAGLKYGGLTGWRLPSRIELISIVDYGQMFPAIDRDAFPDTPSTTYDHGYWSSSPYFGDPNYAWAVDFGFGYVNYVNVTVGQPVRCVQ